MTPFTQAKIHLDADTISEQLRAARQERNIKIEKAARETRISLKHLNALEKGQFDLLPKGLYGKNYLIEYATYLRLDAKRLADLYENEVRPVKAVTSRELFDVQVIKSHYFLSFPKILRGLIIAVLVFVVVLYVVFRLKSIITPPYLNIITPVDNTALFVSNVELKGVTEAETQISINGEQLISDSSGNFSKAIGLKKGINFITVTAKKKYGSEKTEIRRVLRKE